MTHSRIGLAAAALLLVGSAVAVAQSTTISVSPDAIILGRQAGMSLQAGYVGLMKAAVQSKADVSGFKDPAHAIELWAKAIPGMFPPGTEKGEDTAALPAVWSDNAGFKTAAGKLATAAAALQDAAAKGDKDAFAKEFQAVGQSCVGCHRTYRAKKS